MLRGTIRDHVTHQRRPFLRFFACEEDCPTNLRTLRCRTRSRGGRAVHGRRGDGRRIASDDARTNGKRWPERTGENLNTEELERTGDARRERARLEYCSPVASPGRRPAIRPALHAGATGYTLTSDADPPCVPVQLRSSVLNPLSPSYPELSFPSPSLPHAGSRLRPACVAQQCASAASVSARASRQKTMRCWKILFQTIVSLLLGTG